MFSTSKKKVQISGKICLIGVCVDTFLFVSPTKFLFKASIKMFFFKFTTTVSAATRANGALQSLTVKFEGESDQRKDIFQKTSADLQRMRRDGEKAIKDAKAEVEKAREKFNKLMDGVGRSEKHLNDAKKTVAKWCKGMEEINLDGETDTKELKQRRDALMSKLNPGGVSEQTIQVQHEDIVTQLLERMQQATTKAEVRSAKVSYLRAVQQHYHEEGSIAHDILSTMIVKEEGNAPGDEALQDTSRKLLSTLQSDDFSDSISARVDEPMTRGSPFDSKQQPAEESDSKAADQELFNSQIDSQLATTMDTKTNSKVSWGRRRRHSY
jgi:hypothetical protein